MANGEFNSRDLYKAWGEQRLSQGNTDTRYLYTGQMREDTNLYYYGARWYDPSLGRFLQADTILPVQQGTQGWDRYAYVNNNPVNGTDPTGHKACMVTGEGCDDFEEIIINLFDNVEKVAHHVQDPDYTPNGIDDPNFSESPVHIGTAPFCSSNSYTNCFYSRRLFSISGRMKLDNYQMAELAVAVYHDVNTRNRGISDRQKHDTSFWDGGGLAPGNVCIGQHCYPNHEVNYFSQGMYSAANKESRGIGLSTVYIWKLLKYHEQPSEGTLLWFDM